MSGKKTKHIEGGYTADGNKIVINNKTKMFWWLESSDDFSRLIEGKAGCPIFGGKLAGGGNNLKHLRSSIVRPIVFG